MKRWLSRGLRVVIVGGLLGLPAALWVEHSLPVELPVPTGPFAVGRFTTVWADRERELVLWIWYPAAAGQSNAVMDDYLPAPMRAEIERMRGGLISKFLTRDLAKIHAHSIRNAEVSSEQRSYPVVIMRAGASS
jgi:hypothetical protein